jgi:hypothetical protein
MSGGSGVPDSGGSGVPDSDLHFIASGLGKLANLMDDAKRLGFGWLNNGGGGSPVQGIENILRDVCARLDNLSCHIDVASKALNRLVDAVEGLPLREIPIVLMEKESGERAACPSRASEKDRHGATSDVTHAMHMNLDGKLGNKIE